MYIKGKKYYNYGINLELKMLPHCVPVMPMFSRTLRVRENRADEPWLVSVASRRRISQLNRSLRDGSSARLDFFTKEANYHKKDQDYEKYIF
jgi:hypothetical protein